MTDAVIVAVVGLLGGLAGVTVGALLERRNSKRAQTERLLVEAINDLVSAIAEVAGGGGVEAQSRYASAVSRIGIHASPALVATFRRFQGEANTGTPRGRQLLIEALQATRRELGQDSADAGDLEMLLFGGLLRGDERDVFARIVR